MREPVVQEIVINGITYIPSNEVGCQECDFNKKNCTISGDVLEISLCDIFNGYGLKHRQQ